MIGIYKITNNINNKIYIGQSVDIERRWKQHIAASRDSNHSSYYNQLYKDMRHYGLDNFSFSIVITIPTRDKKKLDELELYYMHKYDTLRNGYNINAAAGQKICLENINSHEKLLFSSFEECERYLKYQGVTTAKKIAPFLKRKIKSKEVIYNRYIIYYERS